MTQSKFTAIVDAAGAGKGQDKPARKTKRVKTPAAPVEPKRRGRPPGKRSDPDFEQITAYIRRDTHHSVKVALLQEGKGQEFSELMESLLAKWLKSRS